MTRQSTKNWVTAAVKVNIISLVKNGPFLKTILSTCLPRATLPSTSHVARDIHMGSGTLFPDSELASAAYVPNMATYGGVFVLGSGSESDFSNVE